MSFLKVFHCFLCILLATDCMADNFVITGRLIDNRKGEPVAFAAVKLMHSDSSFVGGEMADSLGRFKLTPTHAGKYIVKASLIGYESNTCNVTLTEGKDSVDLGNLKMTLLDQKLQGVDVKAYAAKVLMRGDTIAFNASAYRLQPGSMLEELIRRLPGVSVSDNGSITVNGKKVSEIKINGKDFFKGNTNLAMKNLPADMVSEVKSYEEESRESRHTGIKEKEKKTVLDVTLRKELKSTLLLDGHTNLTAQKRYDQNFMVNDFTDLWNFSAFTNMNNVPSSDDFDASSGLQAKKEVGLSGNWTNKKKDEQAGKVDFSGNATYSYDDNDSRTTSNSETFLSSSHLQSYSIANDANRNHSRNFSANMDFFWAPDSMDFIIANGGFNHSNGRNRSGGLSAKFSDDPFSRIGNGNLTPDKFTGLQDILVNSNQSQSLGINRENTVNGTFLVAHRFDSIGNTIGAWITANKSYSRSRTFTVNDIRYYQLSADSSPQSFYDQYINSPSSPYSIKSNIGYKLPLVKDKREIYFIYEFSHSFNDQNRNWYQLDSLQNVVATHYPGIGWLPTADSLEMVRNMKNSQYTRYWQNQHSLQLEANMEWGKITVRPGLNFQIQHQKLRYEQGDYQTSQSRTVSSINPSLWGRWKMSKSRYLNFDYHGNTTAPDMLNLIDIPDESNPLYVTMGNKNLKNSWSHNLNSWYSDFNEKHQQAVSANASFSQSFNDISNRLTYDILTGKQTSQPQNINGNWNASLGGNVSRSFGKENRWNLQVSSQNSYSHNVGYVSSTLDSVNGTYAKNIMKTFAFNESIEGSFRIERFDISLKASVSLNTSHSNEGIYNKLNTTVWTFKNHIHWQMFWKIDLTSDFGIRMRRGYSDSEMNTTECLWNAGLAKSFFKEKNLSIGLKATDILHQRKYFTRTVNATTRNEFRSNHVGSYVMFTLNYRFNILNTSKSK